MPGLLGDAKQNIWYEFKNHKYEQIDIENIKRVIVDDFCKDIELIQADAANRVIHTTFSGERASCQSLIQLCAALIAKLRNITYKGKLINEMKLYYNLKEFNGLKDTESHFMGCSNGVIDVRGSEAMFRYGKPEDYITKSAGYFPEDYTYDTPQVKQVQTYMSQVMRSTPKLECLWRFFASRLVAGNMDKIFLIWEGEKGNNSKSMLVKLIELAMGEYVTKVDSTYLTDSKKSASGASAADVHAIGTRIVFFQEPDPDSPIKNNVLKEITGQDTMAFRDLFQKGSEMKNVEITYVPIIVANKVKFPHTETPVWTRTKLFKFDSEWRENAPESIEEQYKTGIFKLDPKFSTKLKKMAPAFLWLMFQKYKDYHEHGLMVPDEVNEVTNSFRLKNNYYVNFANDCTKPSLIQSNRITADGTPEMIKNLDAHIELGDGYQLFKHWYKINNIGGQNNKMPPPSKQEFQQHMDIVFNSKSIELEDHKIVWRGVEVTIFKVNGQYNI